MWFHGVLNGRKLDVGGQRVVLNYECCGGWWKFRQWEICRVRTKTLELARLITGKIILVHFMFPACP